MTDELWAYQMTDGIPLEQKLNEMAKFAQKPCERTASFITGITLLASKTPFTPAEAKSKTEVFKQLMRSLRSRSTPTLAVFPEDVGDFRKVHDRYDAAKPPVPSRLSLDVFHPLYLYRLSWCKIGGSVVYRSSMLFVLP